MRLEGDFWNAYIAALDTMVGAILIGSIAAGAIKRDDELKERFLLLMQDTIAFAAGDIVGLPVTWPEPPHAAPESERGGNA